VSTAQKGTVRLYSSLSGTESTLSFWGWKCPKNNLQQILASDSWELSVQRLHVWCSDTAARRWSSHWLHGVHPLWATESCVTLPGP